MNDLVFVMHNLKLIDRQKRKVDGNSSFIVDDLSSDDEWIVGEEEDVGSSNVDLLNVFSTTSGKEIDEDAVEEIGAYVNLESHGSKSQDDLEIHDIDAIEAEMETGTSKDLELEDMDIIGSDTDNDINDEDDGDGDDDGDERDGNGRDDSSFDENIAVDHLF